MKTFTWTLALCALVMVSCSQEEAMDSPKVNDPNQINFRSNTSRSAITDLPAMEASAAGFVVYGASGAAPSTWYPGIDGTNNYKKSGLVWEWVSSNPSWPTLPAGYPMNFYAYFAGSYTGLTMTSQTPSSLVGTYTIQAEASQVDFVTAKSSTTTKPASGYLPLTFKHILSKVNFGVIPGFGATVFVQSINTNNLGNMRTYDFVAGNWTAAQPATFTSNYVYKATANPAAALIGIDPTELIPMNVSPTYNNLMLMPQTSTTWTPATGVAAANAFIGVIYRLQTLIDPNSVGYASANNHPNYAGLTPAEKTALNGRPLFVKVGFPFAPSTMTWLSGKGYTYNICLGTASATNGYVVDTRYYDENGNPTTLTIQGKNQGDPLSSGQINFLVSVTDWDNQIPSTIQ